MPLRPDLSEQSILITGAGRGLGKSMAEKLAGCGATVGLVDIDATACSAVAAGIGAAGGRALALPADVSEPRGAARRCGALRRRAWPHRCGHQ